MKARFILMLILLSLLSGSALSQSLACASIDAFVPTLPFDNSYYQEQIASYDAEIAANSSDAELYALRGDAYYALQVYSSAITDYNAAIAIDSEYSYAYARLGDAYQQIFQLEDSLQAYNQAIEIDANYAYVYVKRGNLYRKLADVQDSRALYQLALADLNRAIELDDSSSLAYVRRSDIYSDLEQWDLALADARAAVRLDDTSVFATASLGLLQYVVGDIDAALASFERALQLPSDKASDYALVFTSRAFVCNRLGNPEQATADLNTALSLDNNFAYAHFLLGRIQEKDDNLEPATENFLAFANLYPIDPFVFELLAYYEVDAQLYKRSLNTFKFWSKYMIQESS